MEVQNQIYHPQNQIIQHLKYVKYFIKMIIPQNKMMILLLILLMKIMIKKNKISILLTSNLNIIRNSSSTICKNYKEKLIPRIVNDEG